MVGKERREEAAAMVDPQIRHIWAEAVDLSEIRNVEDQTEWVSHVKQVDPPKPFRFRSLRAQLGIDVSFLPSIGFWAFFLKNGIK